MKSVVSHLGEVCEASDGRLSLIRSYKSGPVLFGLEAWRGGCPNASAFVRQRYAAEGLGQVGDELAVEGGGRVITTFVARRGEAVVGTLTIAIVEEHGLVQASAAYPFEVASLRRKFPILGEFGQLATEPSPHGQAALAGLFHLGLLHAFAASAEVAVAEVHPRHAMFYGRALGMRRASSDVRTCRRVGAPGVMLHGHLSDIARRVEQSWQADGRGALRRWFHRDDALRLLCELEIAVGDTFRPPPHVRLVRANWDRLTAGGLSLARGELEPQACT